MKKKRFGIIGVLLVIAAILFVYPLDTYISKPGGAYDLAPLVEVVGGDEDDQGKFNMMTISVAKATPATYVYARFSDNQKLLPAQNVRREGENDKEYNIRQKKLMSSSQYNAVAVAFEKAGIPVDIQFDGVFVLTVLEGGAADGILEVGDKIREIDGIPLTESSLFFDRITDKKIGDQIEVKVEREGKTYDYTIALKEIPNSEGRVGLGVSFEEDKKLETDPKVEFLTSNIGGPSAGLMFTLEILNRLVDEDITKGYNIAGTGEMLEDGTVGRIGGADFKVIAASRKGVEIFFAPDDEISEEMRAANPDIQTNYEEAVKSAERIGTKMKIVPVKTVDDALDYLASLEEK
ncbi:PDZ domain-containing protein [Sporosarcina sp. ACRSM]|uniref:SepM family pheromone-processing serine protease n=1 Tax=Sporosarcina sp. ACRSM TaxID=2918216 RepID=UPI001EF44EFA|nr:SepM family pheromone-processing serine protease [Sporosarcina sp. ACRSM]MCG7334162.1 PDZ domain-containing protein [Sporosarcina sp. ACRSM]